MKRYAIAGAGEMPAIGLGTWKLDEGADRTVAEALDIGYRHIDCARIYGNEQEIGEALEHAFDRGVVARGDLWITSKLWNDMHEPAKVRPALERSLTDLRLDRLDLYLIHWPVVFREGVMAPQKAEDLRSLAEVPLNETWSAMEDCLDAGLCRAIGVSNFNVPKLTRLLDGCRVRPAVNQVEAHPFLQQPELLEFCREQRIHLTAYSPLGSRDRPVPLKRDAEPSLLEHPVVRTIADEHGATPAQVLLAWSVARGTSVLVKSSRADRLRENLAAGALTLDDGDLTRLAALDRGFRYVHAEFFLVEDGPYTLAGIWDD